MVCERRVYYGFRSFGYLTRGRPGLSVVYSGGGVKGGNLSKAENVWFMGIRSILAFYPAVTSGALIL